MKHKHRVINNNPQPIWIIVDNLRIGGIERLALDQMYSLSDQKQESKLFILSRRSTLATGNFWENEKAIIERKNLKIEFCPTGALSLIRFFGERLIFEKPKLIIDYTIKMSTFLRLITIFLFSPVPIHCVIQQLASLSSPRQRLKRMFYAQFSTKLFINSIYYSKDWDYNKLRFRLGKYIFRKPHSVLRNGVYLDRLNFVNLKQIHSDKTEGNTRPRFIFLGRLKSWKGMDRLKVLDRVMKKNCDFLIISPSRDEEIEKTFTHEFSSRVGFMIGKSLIDYKPEPGDIHIYGVNYEPTVKFPESVSTNCLEMSLLQVPSMVTKGGTANWPELDKLNLIFEVDWTELKNIFETIRKIQDSRSSRRLDTTFVQMVDVKRNLDEHMKLI